MFCAKLVSQNIHTEVLIRKSYTKHIYCNYISLLEIMCSYEAKNFEKHK
jgi:hypothetical protein